MFSERQPPKVTKAIRDEGGMSTGEFTPVPEEKIPSWLTETAASKFPLLEARLEQLGKQLPPKIRVLDVLATMAGIYSRQLLGNKKFPEINLILDDFSNFGYIKFGAQFGSRTVSGSLYTPNGPTDYRMLWGLPWCLYGEVHGKRHGLAQGDFIAGQELTPLGMQAVNHLARVISS